VQAAISVKPRGDVTTAGRPAVYLGSRKMLDGSPEPFVKNFVDHLLRPDRHYPNLWQI